MILKAKRVAPPVPERSFDTPDENEPDEFMFEADAEVDAAVDADEARPGKEPRLTTTKVIVLLCLLNGFAWVWCSYILAWNGKEQIAESLSQVALTEIIAVVLVYAAKSVFENLSKNNSWPDKPGSDPPDGC